MPSSRRATAPLSMIAALLKHASCWPPPTPCWGINWTGRDGDAGLPRLWDRCLIPNAPDAVVPALTHLHAHLAAQDERFTPIVPLWQRAGIFDDPASGHGTPTLPLPSPAKTAPLAIPGSPTTDPHAGGGTPSKYRAWAALFAVMICAVLAAQHMLWRGFVEGLATKLAAGG